MSSCSTSASTQRRGCPPQTVENTVWKRHMDGTQAAIPLSLPTCLSHQILPQCPYSDPPARALAVPGGRGNQAGDHRAVVVGDQGLDVVSQLVGVPPQASRVTGESCILTLHTTVSVVWGVKGYFTANMICDCDCVWVIMDTGRKPIEHSTPLHYTTLRCTNVLSAKTPPPSPLSHASHRIISLSYFIISSGAPSPTPPIAQRARLRVLLPSVGMHGVPRRHRERFHLLIRGGSPVPTQP